MTREKVWEQAQKQYGVASLTDKECDSYIYKGIKIMKCNGVFRIFNTKMKGDFYQEITEDQYKMFEIKLVLSFPILSQCCKSLVSSSAFVLSKVPLLPLVSTKGL